MTDMTYKPGTARHLERLLREHPEHGTRALGYLGMSVADLFGAMKALELMKGQADED